jgi:hypothetical protein
VIAGVAPDILMPLDGNLLWDGRYMGRLAVIWIEGHLRGSGVIRGN